MSYTDQLLHLGFLFCLLLELASLSLFLAFVAFPAKRIWNITRMGDNLWYRSIIQKKAKKKGVSRYAITQCQPSLLFFEAEVVLALESVDFIQIFFILIQIVVIRHLVVRRDGVVGFLIIHPASVKQIAV